MVLRVVATAKPADFQREAIVVVVPVLSFASAFFTRASNKCSIAEGAANDGMGSSGHRVFSFPLSDGYTVACATAKNGGICSFEFHGARFGCAASRIMAISGAPLQKGPRLPSPGGAVFLCSDLCFKFRDILRGESDATAKLERLEFALSAPSPDRHGGDLPAGAKGGFCEVGGRVLNGGWSSICFHSCPQFIET